jgi:hypothetical protein
MLDARCSPQGTQADIRWHKAKGIRGGVRFRLRYAATRQAAGVVKKKMVEYMFVFVRIGLTDSYSPSRIQAGFRYA